MTELEQIIERLSLTEHPEGGFYSETYRSEEIIPGKNRNLMTAIYFLLTSHNSSNFHRIKSDELWFYHSGSPIVVHSLDGNGHHEQVVGPDLKSEQTPQFMVPSGTIFGSSVLEEDSYSLVSCVVAPGFDFKDFKLFTKDELLAIHPNHLDIITKLTT